MIRLLFLALALLLIASLFVPTVQGQSSSEPLTVGVAGRDHLLSIGLLLLLVAILHNAVGYVLGYWGCRWLGMDKRDSRTIAFEVGMQNGGISTTVL